jgi:tripartite-type tricarboxylate transporter receptor subunit TctC
MKMMFGRCMIFSYSSKREIFTRFCPLMVVPVDKGSPPFKLNSKAHSRAPASLNIGPLMKIRASFWLACLACLAGTGLALNANAQAFPQKSIQVVVPVAAGGGTDLLARNLSQRVSEILGQPLVVDNKLGAGGNIGVEYVMKSKPDGYTLLVSPATIATNVAVYRKLPYDLIKDLQAITLIGQTGVVLVVHPSVKVNNLKEFIDLMKSKNGDMNYGSAGMGSPQHLQAEFFNQLVGLKSNHIPYKGQAQAMNDLIGGQLQYMFSPIQNALPQIQQGRLKALAVASATRHKAMPQVPTLNEQGYQGVELTNWFAVYAPINTPPAVVKKLNAAFIQAGKEPKMKEKLDTLGFESFFTTSEEATDFMRSEIVRWARVAAYAGIKAE